MNMHLPKDAAIWLTAVCDEYLGFLRATRPLPLIEQRLAARLIDAFEDGKKIIQEDEKAQPYHSPYDVHVRGAIIDTLGRQPEATLRWLLIAWDLMSGAHDFCRDQFELLVAEDVANVAWAVSGASWVRYWSGQDTTPQLLGLLRKLEAQGVHFTQSVAAMSKSQDHFLSSASSAALTVLGGQPLPDKIG